MIESSPLSGQDQTAYAFDSTTIDLCLSLFLWAKFRKHKAAVKLHTLIDLRGALYCPLPRGKGKETKAQLEGGVDWLVHISCPISRANLPLGYNLLASQGCPMNGATTRLYEKELL